MSIRRLMTTLNMILVCPLLAATVSSVRGEDVFTAAKPANSIVKPRVFADCELYAPGHFGNSYEVLGPNEMREVLAEAKFWGFNRYADWFDTDDCKDPFVSGHTYALGDAQWDAKKTN